MSTAVQDKTFMFNCPGEVAPSKGFNSSSRMQERRALMRQDDWRKILAQCKNRIQEQISPLLKTLNQPQPDLGIGAGGDPIRKIDLAAENAVVDTLTARRVSFTLISEESGVRKYGESPQECYVTVDPIDGTTNLMRGVPFYATSIAVSEKPFLKDVHSALVADLFHGTTYTAQKGGGSFRDNRSISPSDNVSLEEAVVGIDLNSYEVERIVPRLTELIRQTKHMRHFGANALELCYVADGTTDAFIDIRGKLRTTDVAAACLIVKEAGAVLTLPDGKPLDVRLDPAQKVEFIAAANAEMHRTILDLVKSGKEKQ
jgi:myo-inositol-1(or 4)-monophosphatase